VSTYTIAELSFDNEFGDLAWVGKYVDSLMKSTGEAAYGVVYEWEDDNADRWPPYAVLTRRDGQWFRRRVLVSAKVKGTRLHFGGKLRLGEEELVNGH